MMSNKTSPVVKPLMRAVAAAGGALALSAAFGAGTASAINEYEGMTYADAANSIAGWGGTPVISSKVGSFLPTSQCVVTGSHNSSSLNSSGQSSGSKVLLDLNCNYMFSLPGVPGNSKASPEGREAYDQAVQQAQQAQEAQQAQAGEEAGAGG